MPRNLLLHYLSQPTDSDNIGGCNAGMQAVYRVQGFVIGGESDFRRKQ
jgi:hypothetical protein